METNLKEVTKKELLELIDKWTNAHRDVGLMCMTVERGDDDVDVDTFSAGKPIELVATLCTLLLDKVEEDELMGWQLIPPNIQRL